MADSDILFLGNWNSQQPSSTSFVSAIVLSPVSPGTTPDSTRTFSRNQTSVVHVGRTPCVDPPLSADDSRATFVNPVMSRNHAKITFAESGSVFIIDTNSHHGTWVARTPDPNNFKLAPESPFQLQDGDRLTFGKEVQRNGILYQPLTVAVKLLRTASTPSSMSISSASASVSPNSKASPKPRNRFGLNQSSDSDSDASSDSEDLKSPGSGPSTGPNAIHVDLPLRNAMSGSPKSPKVAVLVDSESSSPDSTKCYLATPQPSQPSPPVYSSFSPASPPDLVSPPGLQLEGMPMRSRLDDMAGRQLDAMTSGQLRGANLLEGMSDSSPHSTSDPKHSPEPSPSTTPPWRRLGGTAPWTSLNASFFDRMPDLLQQPPRKIGRLLNPLWVRASRGAAAEDGTGGGRNLISRIQGAEVVEVSHGHRHGSDHDHHGHEHAHAHRLDHEDHGHGHGHGRRSGRLDADWGVFGHGSSAVKDEVRTLGEQLEALKKEVESLKTKDEDSNGIHAVFSSRLDELSSQFKTKSAEDAKASQQASFAELAGLNSLKDSIAAFQNDISVLKAHRSAMQADIRFLRMNHEELRNDFSCIKDDSEVHVDDVANLMEDVRGLQKDAHVLREEFDVSRSDAQGFKTESLGMRDDILAAQGDMRTLQSDMRRVDLSTTELGGKFHEMASAQETAEQDLRTRIREEVRMEMKALAEQGRELPSVIGKRKRGDEEFAGPPADAIAPAPAPVSRPRKRLRVVVNCAAAGAVGALGAWLGLAFM